MDWYPTMKHWNFELINDKTKITWKLMVVCFYIGYDFIYGYNHRKRFRKVKQS